VEGIGSLQDTQGGHILAILSTNGKKEHKKRRDHYFQTVREWWHKKNPTINKLLSSFGCRWKEALTGQCILTEKK